MIDTQTRYILRSYAAKYETSAFLDGDPSAFMHKVKGVANQETMAFIASCLSYGSRSQFLPKIELIRNAAGGEPAQWVYSGAFEQMFRLHDTQCFYRLYTYGQMSVFLMAYRALMLEYGSLGEYVSRYAGNGLKAVEAICERFAKHDIQGIIPKDATSCCKRVCMFLRWMVRDGSPVDLGLWKDIIDKRTLIIPMDTHVLTQSVRMGLLDSKTTTMKTALKLTDKLAEVFPDDPLKGDFALFGYGVNNK